MDARGRMRIGAVLLGVLASGAALALGAALASAAPVDSAAPSPPWYEAITVNGLVSSSYSYNFNRPPSRLNGFRVFDFNDNSFKLDVAELVLQKPTPKAGDAGFRVDVAAGGSIPRVSAAAGLFRDSGGNAQDIDLQQAYVGYLANAGRGLRLDFGKFVTHHGYEVIDGYDGWNDNVTRSFLFGYAIPFTHTGVRAAYSFSDRVSSTVMVINGWDDATDNNRQKSVGAQLSVTPAPEWTVILNGMYGAERADDSGDARTLLDLVSMWKPAGSVALGLNLDHGREKNAVAPGQNARWDGVAAYARIRLTERFSLVGRAEHFADWDGARTGVSQRLSEITLTPELRPARGLVIRGDLRFDHSDHRVFDARSGPKQDQATANANVLFAF